MLFTSLVTAFPLTASAAYSGASVTQSTLSKDNVKAIADAVKDYHYANAQEMFEAELAAGYLDSITKGNFSLYINRYTGYLYYINNVTGQILTSNPENSKGGDYDDLMSQLIVNFTTIVGGDVDNYASFRQAARRNQISVSAINGGIRVSYTLGDTTTRYLLPQQIHYDDFVSNILDPLLEQYVDLLVKYKDALGATEEQLGFYGNPKYDTEDLAGFIINPAKRSIGLYGYISVAGSTQYVNKISTVDHSDEAKADVVTLKALNKAISQLLTNYTLQNPNSIINNNALKDDQKESQLKALYSQYPVLEKEETYTKGDGTTGTRHTVIFTLNDSVTDGNKSTFSGYIKKYVPTYTYTEMYANEAKVGYISDFTAKPTFRMALVYTLGEKGELEVTLPSSSISFDETSYILNSVKVLPFFGASDRSHDGYLFLPDGSGSIIEFDDLYNAQVQKNINISLDVYGSDFAHASLSGAHREQTVIPVFGQVNEVPANALTTTNTGKTAVTNGYVAVLEEGASLATINVACVVGTSYIGEYPAYTPYPMDTVNLSDTISFEDSSTQKAVGNLGSYSLTADEKYNGNYVIKYTMLYDPDLVVAGTYPASFVGMATYYRDYLTDLGVLNALTEVTEDLPLYIQVLGMMTIEDKFLSFPIEREIPLTSFEDIEIMYDRLANAKTYVQKLIDEAKANAAAAEAEGDAMLKASYQKEADEYEALLTKIKDIKNVNFRLNGFANEGLHPTYPVKIKWERAVGGKRGFKKLLNAVATTNETAGNSFGIYPNFDLLFVQRTKQFDGINLNRVGARQLDNRYASKKSYDAVAQRFDMMGHGILVSTDRLEQLTDKFLKKYGKYDIKTVSLDTLGSNLSSNLDEDNLINREESLAYTEAVYQKLVENGYELMVEKGNIYTVKYATHILEASVDSSHLKVASYTVPFVGMVIHGTVNYTGTPLNYSGTPSYDILRAIESGASLYYILAFENIAYMKEYHYTNKYYSVDFNNWYGSLLDTYANLNSAIGDLQTAMITDYRIVKGERIVSDAENEKAYTELTDEYVAIVRSQLEAKIAEINDMMFADPAKSGKGILLTFNTDAVFAQYKLDLLFAGADLDDEFVAELQASAKAKLDALKAEFEAIYNSTDPAAELFTFDTVVYNGETSELRYLTVSDAAAADYVSTDYTCENVAIVSYLTQKGDTVEFILNYNIFAVTVNYNGHVYTLDTYDYVRIG